MTSLLRLLVSLAFASLAVANPALAQTTTDAAKADGKAFARDKAAAAQNAATTDPSADRLPNYAGVPGQAGYFGNPDSMARDAASQANANPGYRTMRDSSARRARFAPIDLDAAIARSKTIANDPLAYTSGMSTGGTQGRCIALPPNSASPGRYQATCNVGYRLDTTTESCAIPLTVSTQRTTVFKYYVEVPAHSGFAPNIAEFGSALANGTCSAIGTADTCQTVRAYGLLPSPQCAQYRIDVLQCKTEVSGLSGFPFPATGQLWFAKDVAQSAITTRNDSACAALSVDPACSSPVETCSDSAPMTRNVGGIDVTAPCWAWKRAYQCNRASPAQDCSSLEANPQCTLLRQDCITGEVPCKTFERVYDCPIPPEPSAGQQFICDGDIYCIDGSCETIQREANDEFKDAVVALNSMAQARREWDPTTLSLFKGKRETCGSKVFGILNCCKGKGFPLIPGIQLLMALGCSSEERLLHERDAKGLCAYVGTYCSSKFLGICLVKRKVYCCFESKLTRIIQEQGRQQLNKPWGDPKTEQCLGFSIDEFARLDLSKMDFSEVYAEFTDAARLPDELQATTEIQQKIEDYYARARP